MRIEPKGIRSSTSGAKIVTEEERGTPPGGKAQEYRNQLASDGPKVHCPVSNPGSAT